MPADLSKAAAEAAAEAKAKEEASPAPAEKKKIGKPVLVLLILVLVLGIPAGAYYVLDMLGIQIPFVSDLLQPEDPNADHVEIIQSTLSANFVDNAKAGRLFVVTGQVKNSHRKPRSFIQVTGKLYRKGRAPAGTTSVYAGNALSDIDLANLPFDQITARLGTRTGDNQANVNVQPGQTLPFTIVFKDLPQDLEEYEIESGGSFASQ